MEKPLFSILIPVYKIEKYIKECVESVIKQNFSDFEIILIDDGSPDKCPEICDELQNRDSRIKVIHKKNEGVARARKDGAQLATGDYIICIDGDDWIEQNCLKNISRIIQKTNPDIVCYGIMADNGKKINPIGTEYKEGYLNRKDMEKQIFPILIQNSRAQYFIPSLCGKAIKRELFLNNILANESVTMGEDGACVIPCVFHAESMYILKEYYYFYRYNKDSATKGKKVLNWKWTELVAEHIENKIDIHYCDFEEQLNRKIVHDIFSVVVSQFNREEHYFTIVKDIRENLDGSVYGKAIKNCKFNGSIKAVLMKIALEKRIFFPIYIYSKL